MKKYMFMFICLVFGLSPFNCNAQQEVFSYYGSLEPCRVSFEKNSQPMLFQQFLSTFEIQGKLGEWAFEATSYDGWHKEEVEMKYWEYCCKEPGFKIYPCFRMDCRDGYLVGIYSVFFSQRAWIYNLNLISYDKTGRILEKNSFPFWQYGYFGTQDSCDVAYQSSGGQLYIKNEIIRFEYSSSRLCTPEMSEGVVYSHDPKEVRREKRQYVYKIGDDARLSLVSVSDIDEE